MKKYRVYFDFHSNAGFDVEANDEDEARDKAWDMVENADTFLEREIMNNLEVDGIDAIDNLND